MDSSLNRLNDSATLRVECKPLAGSRAHALERIATLLKHRMTSQCQRRHVWPQKPWRDGEVVVNAYGSTTSSSPSISPFGEVASWLGGVELLNSRIVCGPGARLAHSSAESMPGIMVSKRLAKWRSSWIFK